RSVGIFHIVAVAALLLAWLARFCRSIRLVAPAKFDAHGRHRGPRPRDHRYRLSRRGGDGLRAFAPAVLTNALCLPESAERHVRLDAVAGSIPPSADCL